MTEPQPAPPRMVVTDRLLTVPNILSFLRLCAIPVFIWAILTRHDVVALVALMFSGVSDYLDGKIARAYGQISRVGELLDPIADRLYIATTLLGFAWRDLIPWWFVALIIIRDLLLSVFLLIARRHGQVGLPVHFVGKAATFNLLYAFPVLLMGEIWGLTWMHALGWALAWWGTGLYWVAAAIYVQQVVRVVRATPVRT